MKIYATILITLAVILFIISVVGNIIFNNNKIYCYLFEHKQWKLWESFIKEYKSFRYLGKGEYGDYFVLDDKFGNERYNAVIWDDNEENEGNEWNKNKATIHFKNNCVLCSFDVHHSKKMAELLQTLK